jgi:MFS family permease
MSSTYAPQVDEGAAKEVAAAGRKDALLLVVVSFIRSFVYGLCGVLMAIYLGDAGDRDLSTGGVIAAGMAGNAAASVVATFYADRIGRCVGA